MFVFVENLGLRLGFTVISHSNNAVGEKAWVLPISHPWKLLLFLLEEA